MRSLRGPLSIIHSSFPEPKGQIKQMNLQIIQFVPHVEVSFQGKDDNVNSWEKW